MIRDPRHDILFEPVRIGPVTARNRFYQVPHCNGMGHRDPTPLAVMRGIKAEGGWAVVCTEEVEIHPTSEVAPYAEGRLWDDSDIPALARMVEQVHAHGSLAGIELLHNGRVSANLYSRLTPLTVGHMPYVGYDPVQARRMGLEDIEALRRYHRAAVRRSLEAGFDIVYVYAAHGLNTIGQFLSPMLNTRTDGYGGPIEARARLLREVLEDTLEEVDGRAAVACRISVDELLGDDGFGRADMEAVLGLVGELPDLWDFVVGAWEDDSVTSRFGDEGGQETYVRGLKQLTSKPVVGVGRFTSPDTMARMVRDGILDLDRRGAAVDRRPVPAGEDRGGTATTTSASASAATSASPATTTMVADPLHPEPLDGRGVATRLASRADPARRRSDAKVLVVGAGPAGLEAAMSAGQARLRGGSRRGGPHARRARRARRRGSLGSRPGSASSTTARDSSSGSPNVELALREPPHGATRSSATTSTTSPSRPALAGTATRAGRWHPARGSRSIPTLPRALPRRPDGRRATPRRQRVVVFDDDHYVHGRGARGAPRAARGTRSALVTPAARVSEWTSNTMEQERIQRAAARGRGRGAGERDASSAPLPARRRWRACSRDVRRGSRATRS